MSTEQPGKLSQAEAAHLIGEVQTTVLESLKTKAFALAGATIPLGMLQALALLVVDGAGKFNEFELHILGDRLDGLQDVLSALEAAARAERLEEERKKQGGEPV